MKNIKTRMKHLNKITIPDQQKEFIESDVIVSD